MTKCIYRYTVEVDEEWHQLELYGPILHVGVDTSCQSNNRVSFWAVHDESPDAESVIVRLRVYGTAWDIDAENWAHVGTAITPDAFVWHLVMDMTDKKEV